MIVKVTLNHDQYLRSVDRILHDSQIKSKNNLNNLIRALTLFVDLRMIDCRIHEFYFQLFEYDRSHIEEKFSIFIRNNSL